MSDRLWELIRTKSLLKEGEFKLASGQTSKYFFNMKMTMLDPEGANLIAEAILALPELASIDVIGGMAVGAIPIVSAVCALSLETAKPIPAFFVRKKSKGHGTDKIVEGYAKAGMKAVVVEDVTTTGGSVMVAVNAARSMGVVVDTVITIVDRLEGAEARLAQEGIRLISLYTRADFEAG